MSVIIVLSNGDGELRLGPFDDVLFNDTSISTSPHPPDGQHTICEWAYTGRGKDPTWDEQGWVVEPPYGDDETSYPIAQVVSA